MEITEKITIEMFKISGGIRILEFDLEAISNKHAVVVAQDFYNRLGLIGRYYCETSTGFTFSIC